MFTPPLDVGISVVLETGSDVDEVQKGDKVLLS